MRAVIPCLIAILFAATLEAREVRVTLVHVSDYHSHALPFYAEGSPDRGGIARTIRYLKQAKRKSRALVFSGGDTINKGSPAWSDKFGCAEWPWLNGIVDAMALGNHDADYGAAQFAKCRQSISYPILASNLVDASDRALLQSSRGESYAIFEVDGIRIGVMALAGNDFTRLIREDTKPFAEMRWADRIETARTIVARLRNVEKVNAVVVIGHAHKDEDYALAAAVPGIDVIFGTHSHLKQDLTLIPGTRTWFISPWQYLAYVSRVELTFVDGALGSVDGILVPIDRHIAADRAIARKVQRMQRELISDSAYAPLFRTIGEARSELGVDDQLASQTPLGTFVTEIMRSRANAHAAISTTSSFRQAIAPGPIRLEDLRASLPYPNKILVYELSGASLEKLIELSLSKIGSDSFGQMSGIRYRVLDGRAVDLEILRDPRDPSAGYERVRNDGKYRLATTDYLARVAGGYKELFADQTASDSGLEVRDEVMREIETRRIIGTD